MTCAYLVGHSNTRYYAMDRVFIVLSLAFEKDVNLKILYIAYFNITIYCIYNTCVFKIRIISDR